jgi:hypothetical protein
MQDEILEDVLVKLGKTIDPTTAVKLHKKANKRLQELKDDYDSMVALLTAHSEETKEEPMTLEQITQELSTAEEKDLNEQIKIYRKSKQQFEKLKEEFTSSENELTKVTKVRSKLQVEPLNLDQLIN